MTAAVAVHLQIIRSAAAELELECDRFAMESGVMRAVDAVSFPAEPATDPEIAPICAGAAGMSVAGAFVDLLVAVDRAQAVCHAIARALDGTK